MFTTFNTTLPIAFIIGFLKYPNKKICYKTYFLHFFEKNDISLHRLKQKTDFSLFK